jgi:hypothetical protein
MSQIAGRPVRRAPAPIWRYGPYHITNYAPSPLEPDNCGTPYAFRLCIATLPLRRPVSVEQLDDIPGSVPVGDMPTVIANRPREFGEK